MIDRELANLERRAQRDASREGMPMAIYNLNNAGRRLLVIRRVEDGAPAPYAGPFAPGPRWQAEFPDYPADCVPMLGEGWTDQSWHNDVCPSFIHEESGVLLWCGAGPDGGDYEFVQMVRDDLHGWQHAPAGDVTLLRCDTLGEVRDVLDSLADGASMASALQSARMRLNQLTADDARQLWADELDFGYHGGKACPDLIDGMRALCAREGAITLDGKPGNIFGVGARFGFVRHSDGTGGNVEYSIPAIVAVLRNGGAFKS